MEMPYHSMDKTKPVDFTSNENDESDVIDRYVPTIFPPPPNWIENTTCYSPGLLFSSNENVNSSLIDNVQNGKVGGNHYIRPEDVIKFALILISSIFTVVFNFLFVLVMVNQTNFKKRWIRSQPRYMLISIGTNDLIMGLLVLILSTYPVLYKCWPFGKNLCQIQVGEIICNSYLEFQLFSFKLLETQNSTFFVYTI